jgi:hypothetical protein
MEGGGTFSWAQGRKIPKYGPGHSQSYDSMYFQVRGIHKVRGIYTTSSSEWENTGCAVYIRCVLSTGKYGSLF